jgi:hypothetical protein
LVAVALVDPHTVTSTSATTSQFLIQTRDVFDAIRDASMPKSGQGAIACGFSEAISGALGAVFSRSAASALNDKKTDSQQSKVLNTAAFFGVRGLTRASARILGVPRPIALIITSLLASAASETAKLRSRESEKGVGGTEEDGENDITAELSGSEIAGDIAKWLCFDLILESLPPSISSTQGAERNALYFGVGSFSSTVGAATRENIDHYADPLEERKEKTAWRKTWEKVPKASIEGGILFFIYSFTVDAVGKILPPALRDELIFARFLDKLEGE